MEIEHMAYSCQICNKEYKRNNELAKHIKTHNISIQAYYDKYLRKEDEGVCPCCGKATNFINLRQRLS